MTRNFLLVCALFIATTAGIKAQTNQETISYIEVTGKAEKEIAPDKIYLSIVINEKDYKNKSLAQIEKDMMKTLKNIGIDTKKDLSVTDMASNFSYYYSFIKKNDVKISKEYQLLVTDAKTAGQVILELQKIWISKVNLVKVDNSKIEQYRKEIKVEAIKAAKEKAAMLAEAIGQSIGKAIYIGEQDHYFRSYASMDMANIMVKNMAEAGGIEDAYEAPEIEFEKLKIESTIIVRFALN